MTTSKETMTSKERTDNIAHEMKRLLFRPDLEEQFTELAVQWMDEQIEWLVYQRHMSPKKARTIMVGFATAGDLAQWAEREADELPPSIYSLYQEPDPLRGMGL